MGEVARFSDSDGRHVVSIHGDGTCLVTTKKMAPMGHFRFEYQGTTDQSYPISELVMTSRAQYHHRGPRAEGQLRESSDDVHFVFRLSFLEHPRYLLECAALDLKVHVKKVD